ncbi:MAG: hypothetical protein JXN65_05640 [Clostridia bacterium]|nr:hypothetical protein [Clostridia bacterium]
MNTLTNDVIKMTEKYSEIWESTIPDISAIKKHSFIEKIRAQRKINMSINAFVSQIKKASASLGKGSDWQQDLKVLLIKHAKLFLNIENQDFESAVVNNFTEAAEAFINTAREFDKQIKPQDITQAMRNVWIMNTIQAIAGIEIKHTPSIFAYSMLYPCTDNFLDDTKISKEDKALFNSRLAMRLEGKNVSPDTPNEEKVYELISIIESEYNRYKYPQVFDSILCIHNGQCKSIEQQDNAKNPTEKDIIRISAEKGGTSVLADAYLVCGNLSPELADLVFGFGFALQLVDDLQDSKTDFDNNHITVFSRKIHKENLDIITSRLINFTLSSLDFSKSSSSPWAEDIKKLITDNTLLLIYEAIWKNRKYYSKPYIKNYLKLSPFSYKFLHRKMKKSKKKLRKAENLLQYD